MSEAAVAGPGRILPSKAETIARRRGAVSALGRALRALDSTPTRAEVRSVVEDHYLKAQESLRAAHRQDPPRDGARPATRAPRKRGSAWQAAYLEGRYVFTALDENGLRQKFLVSTGPEVDSRFAQDIAAALNEAMG